MPVKEELTVGSVVDSHDDDILVDSEGGTVVRGKTATTVLEVALFSYVSHCV